ncbi:MAG: hypothetical protein KKD44_13885 [Proteobacteria bacterium]|nr:hypothetical protein [Pseudomonadota bacterium]
MKRVGQIIEMIALVLVCSFSLTAQADSTRLGKPVGGPMHKLVAGAQYHTTIPDFTDLPLKRGDYSYKLLYEYHEGIGFWQLGASYAPSPKDRDIDYVLTPQINLILKDRFYRLGAGALKSRVKGKTESHWTDVYWQICAGLGIPLGSRFSFDVYAHYVFESWDSIRDSDKGGVEYSALLGVTF